MLYHHRFDIITLSETWLQYDKNLTHYTQIPGQNVYYKTDKKDEEVLGCT